MLLLSTPIPRVALAASLSAAPEIQGLRGFGGWESSPQLGFGIQGLSGLQLVAATLRLLGDTSSCDPRALSRWKVAFEAKRFGFRCLGFEASRISVSYGCYTTKVGLRPA